MGTLADGIKEIFSTSKTTTTHLPVCASDGTPQGSISVGNLASVLGGVATTLPSSTYSLSSYRTIGVYRVNGTYASDFPQGAEKVSAVMYVMAGQLDSYVTQQLFVPINSGGSLWIRRVDSSGDATPWLRTDNFGATSIEGLTNDLVKQNALSIGNVMVVTNVDSYTRFWPADRALESGIASIAVGAGIIENGRTLIIAKDASNKQWATSNVTGGTTAITDKRAAIADFDGRAKTTTILATLGDNAPAAKYCNEYYPSNVASSNTNMGAGRWWLPSLGEWAMIWAHVREVNFVLAAIGGTQIPVGSGWTWSSTECSATYAWLLGFTNGNFSYYTKALEGSVRPVSAFY